MTTVGRRVALQCLIKPFLAPLPQLEVKESEGVGVPRRVFLAAAPLLATGVFACNRSASQPQVSTENPAPKVKAKRPVPDARVVLMSSKLDAEAQLLRDYLARQKVVDLKKVAGVYVKEKVLQNPSKYNVAISPQLAQMLRVKTMAAFTMLPLQMEMGNLANGGDITIIKHPTIVMISSGLLPWLQGTPAERRSFESMLYHEVEGHGSDFADNTPFMQFAIRLIGYASSSVQGAQELLNIIEDIKELSAYVVEVDRLIEKFNYDKNPAVVNEDTRVRVDNALSLYTMTILQILRMKGKDAAFDVFIRDMEKFIMWRIKTVSSRTRAYVRKILRKNKWPHSIPF